jgi:hypothetical protein
MQSGVANVKPEGAIRFRTAYALALLALLGCVIPILLL